MLLTFIPFPPSRSGRHSICFTRRDLKPCVRKLVRKLHGMFFDLFLEDRHPLKFLLKTLPVS